MQKADLEMVSKISALLRRDSFLAEVQLHANEVRIFVYYMLYGPKLEEVKNNVLEITSTYGYLSISLLMYRSENHLNSRVD